MTFERGEVKANSNDGDSKAASTTDKNTVAVDKVLVDDENCTITVLNKKQDLLDDCGYTFKVENKTADKTVLFMAEYGTFSVDGQMVDFTLTETVKPGMFAETFGYFDSTKVTDIDAMKNVAGTISLMDNDSYETIASYPHRARIAPSATRPKRLPQREALFVSPQFQRLRSGLVFC